MDGGGRVGTHRRTGLPAEEGPARGSTQPPLWSRCSLVCCSVSPLHVLDCSNSISWALTECLPNARPFPRLFGQEAGRVRHRSCSCWGSWPGRTERQVRERTRPPRNGVMPPDRTRACASGGLSQERCFLPAPRGWRARRELGRFSEEVNAERRSKRVWEGSRSR